MAEPRDQPRKPRRDVERYLSELPKSAKQLQLEAHLKSENEALPGREPTAKKEWVAEQAKIAAGEGQVRWSEMNDFPHGRQDIEDHTKHQHAQDLRRQRRQFEKEMKELKGQEERQDDEA
ncbi:unnamed protein product [Zymoseptoria tritici ST99CH_3D7]|uniref:Uncharacterized protein n=1 Tax=Zymoseptoria tritici (strain ST99CH_3D7) TaxID=1276538 RepID=A0A1X7RZ99_ZYMT9|nr:unnamed protein product [Zymoseptoria tritici ST99CH_3D7]